jgi:hypothetical protein
MAGFAKYFSIFVGCLSEDYTTQMPILGKIEQTRIYTKLVKGLEFGLALLSGLTFNVWPSIARHSPQGL